MSIKFTRSLLFAASLFLLPASFQPLLAAGLSSMDTSTLEKATTNENVKASATSEKMKESSATEKAKASAVSDKAKVNMGTDKLSKINVNSADAKQLAMIKGIGSKTAQAIIDYREKYGDFTNLKDLVNVKGIGASTLEKIMPYLSL
tara:strand:- start:1296 stop:1736 length:441 start_codon:yes stop_codon:yes gene_type:complete